MGMEVALKTLVLGFDGASPNLINEWLDQLPAFGAFKRRGIFGQTVPPVPAQTPVAWTTFMTGRNPGNHGIFSFAMRRRGAYERDIIGPEMLRSKTLWRILSEAGKSIAIINVPMSDIEEVRGFVIPGFLSTREGVPYPDGIKGKILKRFKTERIRGDLDIDTLDKAATDPDLFFERVNDITDEMADISLYLLREGGWDFFMSVFMGLDRIQHFFWKYVDPTHPEYVESEYGRSVRDFYIKVDKITGDFLKSVDDDTVVMVVSDHGFCPIHKEVIVNNYLEEGGFVTARSGNIALENSMAISYGYGDIWLNVRGREPKGMIGPGEEYESIRDQIIESLKGITIDGKRPIKDVRKREEVWWGPYVEYAPDLTIIFNVGYQAARRPEIAAKNELGRYVNDDPRWSGGHDGTHDPEDVMGFIGALGPSIPARDGVKVHLWDLAPTILKLMGVQIPADMDGKPFL